MEAEFAVSMASGNGITSPVIEGALAVCDGDCVGRFDEVGDEGQIAFAAVADVAAEPFSFEVGVLQRVGVDAVQASAQPAGGTKVGDSGANEHLEVADVDAAEVRPPDDLGLAFGVHVNGGDVAVVVVFVQGMRDTDLLQLGDTGDGAGLVTGFGEGGQQHGGQDRDDCDDDQQLNQREGSDFFDCVHLWFLFGDLIIKKDKSQLIFLKLIHVFHNASNFLMED